MASRGVTKLGDQHRQLLGDHFPHCAQKPIKVLARPCLSSFACLEKGSLHGAARTTAMQGSQLWNLGSPRSRHRYIGYLPGCVLTQQRGGSSLGSLLEGRSSLHWGSILTTYHLPKPQPPGPTPWGLGCQPMNLRGGAQTCTWASSLLLPVSVDSRSLQMLYRWIHTRCGPCVCLFPIGWVLPTSTHTAVCIPASFSQGQGFSHQASSRSGTERTDKPSLRSEEWTELQARAGLPPPLCARDALLWSHHGHQGAGRGATELIS